MWCLSLHHIKLRHHITASEAVVLREVRMETGCPPSSPQPLQSPWGCTWGDSGWERKHRMPAPDGWVAYQRSDFSEPRLLYLPLHRKALNSLTWDTWFSFINSNLLMFWLPGLLLQKFLDILALLLPLLNGFLSVIWGAVSWAWSAQKVCWIKHNS